MSAPFKDHFSTVAPDYARYRPHYPAELFQFLAALAPRRLLAWDCATGNGQAAVLLATHFQRVVATDASVAQLANAQRDPKVDYRAASAEASGLEEDSVDLITVAQALHWFDIPRFFAEAGRVLRLNGVLAAWCYGQIQVKHPEAQRILDKFYSETVGPYWPPQRRLLEEGYRTIQFPWDEIRHPGFAITAQFTLGELVGYLGTWSATRFYTEATGLDPLPRLTSQLAKLWGENEEKQPVTWPLSLRLGRQG